MSSENQVWVFAARWSVQNQPLEEDELRELLTEKLKLYCSKWIFQLEDTENNLHYQIYMRVNEKIRAKSLAVKWNAALPGIEIRPCSTAGKEALSKYCMKKETRVAGPWADKAIYMGQDLPTELYRWQSKLRDYLLGPVNDRELICIVDLEGSGGKSKFMKYMYFHHNVPGLTFGKSSDLINIVYKMPDERAYIFNLTRSQPKDASLSDIYATAELIKDGYFANTKYDTGIGCMAPPHVVVMTNFFPKRDHLTADRWTVIDLAECEDLQRRRETRPVQARFSL